MFKHTRTAIMSILIASSLLTGRAWAEATDGKLPEPATAGFAEKLYRVECGHSLANDESVWTPGENVGKSIEFSSTSNRLFFECSVTTRMSVLCQERTRNSH
jgi:N-acyl homoserine lactone hydrolase